MTRRLIIRASQLLSAYMLIALLGCATVFTGTSDQVIVNSSPANAKVEIKTSKGALIEEGYTPLSTKLRRGKNYVVTISLEGYEPKTVGIVKGEISKAAFLNLFSLLSWGIDYLSGALYRFESTTVNVALQESTSQDGTTAIYAVLTFPDEDGEQKSITTKLEPVAEMERVAKID